MVKLFVDDIFFYIVVDNVDILVCLLNIDFEKIYKWLKQWFVFFNLIKMECLIIFNKVKKFFYFFLIFNDVYLKEVEIYKYLGVIFSSNLFWNLYVDEIVKKVYLCFGMM